MTARVSANASAKLSALPVWLQQRQHDCVLTVHVQPGARGAGVVGEHGDALKIRIDSPPVEGRANLALIAFLSERLDLAKSHFNLLSGDTSRRKRLAITGVMASDISKKLGLEKNDQ